MNFHQAFFSANLPLLKQMLAKEPALASTPIALPDNDATALPLHRVCDAVFNTHFPETVGLEIARMLLEQGADVNAVKINGQDSPLTAACSLRCDALALLYHSVGADVNHPGCHGGTALHWAAWCGRDRVLNAIVNDARNINQLCTAFKSTALFWAMHGYRFGGKENRHNQLQCARILIDHGADESIPNFEGYLPSQIVDPDEAEAKSLFRTR